MGWMILAGVAIAAAIGIRRLGALAQRRPKRHRGSNSEDADRCGRVRLRQEAEGRIADARARIDAALADVAGVVVVSDEDVEEAEQAAAEAEESWQRRKPPSTRGKARSSRRSPSANWPEPRRNKPCRSCASRAMRRRLARSDASASREQRHGRRLRGGRIQCRDGRERLLGG